MIKVRAKHNIYDGKVLRSGGTVFEVESIDRLEKYVDVLDAPSAIEVLTTKPLDEYEVEDDESKVAETPKPRTRRKRSTTPKE